VHATNLKRFLEDSLTEKVVLLGGDNFFIGKSGGCITDRNTGTFRMLHKDCQYSLPPDISSFNYSQKLLR